MFNTIVDICYCLFIRHFVSLLLRDALVDIETYLYLMPYPLNVSSHADGIGNKLAQLAAHEIVAIAATSDSVGLDTTSCTNLFPLHIYLCSRKNNHYFSPFFA